MKIRNDFVTNSSSSSFVISKKEVDPKHVKYILDHFTEVSSQKLYNMCEDCNVDEVYYLVDYNDDEDYLHIWVRRDESMYDDEIDDILYDFDKSYEISPHFEYHY